LLVEKPHGHAARRTRRGSVNIGHYTFGIQTFVFPHRTARLKI